MRSNIKKSVKSNIKKMYQEKEIIMEACLQLLMQSGILLFELFTRDPQTLIRYNMIQFQFIKSIKSIDINIKRFLSFLLIYFIKKACNWEQSCSIEQIFFFLDSKCTKICKFVNKNAIICLIFPQRAFKTHFWIDYYCNFYILLKKNTYTNNDIRTYHNFCFIMFFFSILTIKYLKRLMKNNSLSKF